MRAAAGDYIAARWPFSSASAFQDLKKTLQDTIAVIDRTKPMFEDLAAYLAKNADALAPDADAVGEATARIEKAKDSRSLFQPVTTLR